MTKNTLKIDEILDEVHYLREKNEELIFENNKLKEELMDIKSLGMFEFADKYCNDKQLADAGHAFARALGVGGA